MLFLSIKSIFLKLFYKILYEVSYKTPDGKMGSAIFYNLSEVKNFKNRCKDKGNKVLDISFILCEK